MYMESEYILLEMGALTHIHTHTQPHTYTHTHNHTHTHTKTHLSKIIVIKHHKLTMDNFGYHGYQSKTGNVSSG
jgi:hypothetical protein